jgi:hypothetical protein
MSNPPRHLNEPRATALQAATLRLFTLLTDVSGMTARERESFAAISRRAHLATLGPELLLDEAERALAEAA